MKKHWCVMALFALQIVGFAFLQAGCSNGATKDTKDAEPAKAAIENPIIEFEGGGLSVDDMKLLLEKMPPRDRMQYQSNPAQFKMLVDELAKRAVIASAAREEGLDKNPAVQLWERVTYDQILMQEYFEKNIRSKIDNMVISEEELKKHYDDNIGEYDSTQVKASHILLKDTDGSREEEAKALCTQVKAAPETFAEVAKAKSDDPGSAVKGGDLGFFGRKQMVPPFEAAAFALEKGEISEPVKSMFGWHIILLEEKTETGIQSFDEVKAAIQNTLRQSKSQAIIEDAINALNEKKGLKVHEDKFEQVFAKEGEEEAKTPPPPPPPPTDLDVEKAVEEAKPAE